MNNAIEPRHTKLREHLAEAAGMLLETIVRQTGGVATINIGPPGDMDYGNDGIKNVWTVNEDGGISIRVSDFYNDDISDGLVVHDIEALKRSGIKVVKGTENTIATIDDDTHLVKFEYMKGHHTFAFDAADLRTIVKRAHDHPETVFVEPRHKDLMFTDGSVDEIFDVKEVGRILVDHIAAKKGDDPNDYIVDADAEEIIPPHALSDSKELEKIKHAMALAIGNIVKIDFDDDDFFLEENRKLVASGREVPGIDDVRVIIEALDVISGRANVIGFSRTQEG